MPRSFLLCSKLQHKSFGFQPGEACIMGRKPTSFGAKPQHRSYVSALRKNYVIHRLNDTACATQKRLCLTVKIKKSESQDFRIFGRDSWTRTSGYRSQRPVPYHLAISLYSYPINYIIGKKQSQATKCEI